MSQDVHSPLSSDIPEPSSLKALSLTPRSVSRVAPLYFAKQMTSFHFLDQSIHFRVSPLGAFQHHISLLSPTRTVVGKPLVPQMMIGKMDGCFDSS
jgi:hypothetical protein